VVSEEARYALTSACGKCDRRSRRAEALGGSQETGPGRTSDGRSWQAGPWRPFGCGGPLAGAARGERPSVSTAGGCFTILGVIFVGQIAAALLFRLGQAVGWPVPIGIALMSGLWCGVAGSGGVCGRGGRRSVTPAAPDPAGVVHTGVGLP
jgi:hypothetical protein